MTYEDYVAYMKEHGFFDKMQGRILNPEMCPKIIESLTKLDAKNILEIGRFKGHSLGLFRFICPDAKVVSIDTVNHKEATAIAEHFGGCELVNGTSDKLKKRTDKFDFILIDGDHSYKWAKRDWDNVQNVLGSPCIVVFDDLDHGYGCGKAFYELEGYDTEIIKTSKGYDGNGYVYIK